MLRKIAADAQTRHAIAATATSLLMKLGAAGSTFIVILVVARRFGADGSGIFGLATTIMSIAQVIGSLGLDLSAVRAVSATYERNHWTQLRAWTTTATLLTSCAALTTAFIAYNSAPYLAALLGGGAPLKEAIRVLSIATVPLVFSRLFAAYLRGARRFIAANFVDPFLFPATAAVLLLVLPLKTLSEATLAYASSAFLVGLAGYTVWLWCALQHGAGRDRLRPVSVILQTLPVYGTLFGAFATPWVVMLALGHLGTLAEAGIYRTAAQFVLLIGFIFQSVETGMSPQFAAVLNGDFGRIAGASRRITLLLLFAGGVPGCIVLIFAPELLKIFGTEFLPGATALRIMAAAQIAVGLLGPVGSIMLMTGLERYSLLNSLAGAALVIVLSVVLVPRFGVTGGAIAASATLVCRAISATIIVWIARGFFFPLGLSRTNK